VTDSQYNFKMLSDYVTDWHQRKAAQEAWDARHPDSSDWDHRKWDEIVAVDPRPHTADVLTEKLWIGLVELALAAFKDATDD